MANDLAAQDLPPSFVCRKVPRLPTIQPSFGSFESNSMSKRIGGVSEMIGRLTTSHVFAEAAAAGSVGMLPSALVVAAPTAACCSSARRVRPSATEASSLSAVIATADAAAAHVAEGRSAAGPAWNAAEAVARPTTKSDL